MAHDADVSWAFPQPDIAPHAASNVLRVAASDGATLTCWTNERDATRFDQTLLYFHGNGEVVSKLALASDLDGLPFTRDLFDHLLRAARTRTVAVEYRGYGANAALGPPSMTSVLSDAEDVFAALGAPTRRVAVMGRSVGSIPARALARAHPDLAGLLLESAIGGDLCHWLASKVPDTTTTDDDGVPATTDDDDGVDRTTSSSARRADALRATPLGRRLAAIGDVDALTGLRGRVTLLHCADDDTTPVGAIDALFEALCERRAAAATADAIIFAPSPHGGGGGGAAAVERAPSPRRGGGRSRTRRRAFAEERPGTWTTHYPAPPVAGRGGASDGGGSLPPPTRAAETCFARFDVGGHNFIWPMNWKEYSAVVLLGVGGGGGATATAVGAIDAVGDPDTPKPIVTTPPEKDSTAPKPLAGAPPPPAAGASGGAAPAEEKEEKKRSLAADGGGAAAGEGGEEGAEGAPRRGCAAERSDPGSQLPPPTPRSPAAAGGECDECDGGDDGGDGDGGGGGGASCEGTCDNGGLWWTERGNEQPTTAAPPRHQCSVM